MILALKAIEKSFSVSTGDMRRIAKDFRSEMEKGLAGKVSSLKMIPSYACRPTGNEKGECIALDLGGTNFRILEIVLKGGGRVSTPRVMRFALKKRHIAGSGERLFDFLAVSLKKFIKARGISSEGGLKLGFTFSFPVHQVGAASGSLARWTKGFSASGVVGKDVVKLLGEALGRQGLPNVEVAALVNDTVGTLAAESYRDPNCDIGVIIGTGTNACYAEKISNIACLKLSSCDDDPEMIINIEWGNFNGLARNGYDRQLDRASSNPGEQVLEKMVSGLYMGEQARLIFRDLVRRGLLFAGGNPRFFEKKGSFKTEYMSEIETDGSKGLSGTRGLFRRLGIFGLTLDDARIYRRICELISTRSARVSASCISAIIDKIDPRLSRSHTIAVDGSVYEKYPGFSENLKTALMEIFPAGSRRLKTVLSKDGSGRGAAIIAATRFI